MNRFDEVYHDIINSQVDESRLGALAAAGILALSPMSHDVEAKTPVKTEFAQDQYSSIHRKNIIAITLWKEARGEGEKGIRYVASVIYNRAQGAPNKLVSVIKKPKQFEVWNDFNQAHWDPKSSKIQDMYDDIDEVYGPKGSKRNTADGAAWDIINKVAKEMVTDQFTPVDHKVDQPLNISLEILMEKNLNLQML